MATLDERLFNLRVLIEFDSTYNAHVARCLETGSVVTADDEATLKSMITELLEDEISFALDNDNLANLFSTPAPLDVWFKWDQEIRKGVKPDFLPLNIRIKEQPSHERDGLAGVKMALAA
jgi:hypothetical protein